MTEIKRREFDKRKKNFFSVDNVYIDEYARLLSPTATIIYMWLCRFADKDGESYPSLRTLADCTGMNEKTIRRNLELLEAHNIISKKRFGRTKNNRYYLVDKSEWIKVIGQNVHSEEKQATGQNAQSQGEEVSGQNVQSGDRTKSPVENESDWTKCPPVIGHLEPEKGTPMSNHSNNTQLTIPRYNDITLVTNVTNVQPEAAEGDEINQVFNVFYEINSTINYGNRTERTAAQRLIRKLGLEKTIAAARAAVTAAQSNDQYAPSITGPLELEKKLPKLVNFYKRSQSQSNTYALQTTNPDL